MGRPPAINLPILGFNVAQLRALTGLSQPAFGATFGVSENTVSRWENGHVLPSLEHLIAMADEVGWSLDRLIGRSVRRKTGIAG